MFGLREPGLVPWFGCMLSLVLLVCMCGCEPRNLAKANRLDLGWVGFSLGLDQVVMWLSLVTWVLG